MWIGNLERAQQGSFALFFDVWGLGWGFVGEGRGGNPNSWVWNNGAKDPLLGGLLHSYACCLGWVSQRRGSAAGVGESVYHGHSTWWSQHSQPWCLVAWDTMTECPQRSRQRWYGLLSPTQTRGKGTTSPTLSGRRVLELGAVS